MRIAFVDLLFSWPPHGGADVDAWHVASGLQTMGHEVTLIGVRSGITWERGDFDPAALPFPAQRLDFEGGLYQRGGVVSRIREAVDAIAPDAVYMGDSFFLKPYLIDALRGYPMMARFYAHELICQKDILRYRDGAPCSKTYLDTPEACRACGLEHLGPALKSGAHNAWTEEYVAAEAFAPGYWDTLREALRVPRVLITYNEGTAALLRPHAQQVAVVPGGVDVSRFPATPPPTEERKLILMSGRGEDPMKGASVLLEAGRRLAKFRKDFEIRITMPDASPEPWFTPLPWCDHATMVTRYAEASIGVVPSIWEEPFGMVALEAMACARPVIVSDVGGLRDTIEHGVSGFRFERGDAGALAENIERLLDDAPLRERMGRAARERAEACFSWEVILRDHYAPLLAMLEA